MSHSIPGTLKKYCEAARIRDETAGNETRFFTNSAEIDPIPWNHLAGQASFLDLTYLSSMEDSHNSGLDVRYAIFSVNGETAGIGAFQITHFITSDDAYSNPVLKFANRVTKFLRRGHIHNVLIAGNAFATGEHGFVFQPWVSDARKTAFITSAMERISRDEAKKGVGICAMLVKDFYPGSRGLAKGLGLAGFKNFNVDHNMVMPLLPEWNSLDDYLQAMGTKFRTKAKAAFSKSAALTIRQMDADMLKNYQDHMQRLYENVYGRADFRLGKLNVKVLPVLLQRMPKEFSVKGYWLKNDLVGFSTAMKCGDVIEAHIIGINYDYNKDFAIYQRILYDYVELAISHKCRRIVYGRTAAEMKSTIGALPVDLTCCMLHRRRISNALLRLILQYVKADKFDQRYPYKTDVTKRIAEQKLY